MSELSSDSSSAKTASAKSERCWRFRQHRFSFAKKVSGTFSLPLLMGIVNVTPDSFSDGGQFSDADANFNVDAAVQHALQLADDGADILDVGGESTRPGSAKVSVDDELTRVIPVVRQLAKQTDLPISIDTTKADVARQAIDAGAVIVNDISGLLFDPQMVDVCRDTEVGVICMHMQGTPQTMQNEPVYENVVSEICEFFIKRLHELETSGIPRERICIDPGIGFGKTAAHNIEILSHIARFRDIGSPVLIGHSRKRFLGELLNRSGNERRVDERHNGTVGVSLATAVQGVDILRLHDVKSTRDCLLAFSAIAERC